MVNTPVQRMTAMPFFFSQTIRDTASACRLPARLAMAAPLIFLAACTSVQLPPWVPNCRVRPHRQALHPRQFRWNQPSLCKRLQWLLPRYFPLCPSKRHPLMGRQ